MKATRYYARNAEDKALDDQIRRTVRKSDDPALMALYLQGQAILNLLRKLVPIEPEKTETEEV